jgi:integrase
MPKINVEPQDIIRKEDVVSIFKKIVALQTKGDPILYEWIGRDGKKKTQRLWINYPSTACLISILWLFGKRISEVLQLKRKDVWTSRGYFYIRFSVLKKKKKQGDVKSATVPVIQKIKRLHVEKHQPLSGYILQYCQSLPHPEDWLFPGKSKPHVQVVRNTKTGKTYKYKRDTTGHMSRITAYKILKVLNPNYYPHFFRRSLATALAEEHFNAIELKHWFDWEKIDTAMRYINESGVLTERISNREI